MEEMLKNETDAQRKKRCKREAIASKEALIREERIHDEILEEHREMEEAHEKDSSVKVSDEFDFRAGTFSKIYMKSTVVVVIVIFIS